MSWAQWRQLEWMSLEVGLSILAALLVIIIVFLIMEKIGRWLS